MKYDSKGFKQEYSLEHLFSDPSYCKDEILRIREAWGNIKTFNEKTIDASRTVLGYILLYCNDLNIANAAQYTIEELSRREFYFLIGRKREAKNNEIPKS